MRQTLFYIPHALGPLPLFGWVSWSMLALILYFGITLWDTFKRSGEAAGKAAFMDGLFNWAIGAGVLGYVLPMIETKVAAGTAEELIVGLPVRGYGMMMMLGVLSAVALANRRVMQLGVSKESYLSLVLWTVIGGLLGARLFYVVQKWQELDGETFAGKLWTALQFTEGGLVVYGAVLGGIVGIVGWTVRQRVNPWSLLDAIVPAFFIGLAFGRIGCLLNGCCYGGIASHSLPSIEFPRGAPAYVDQLSSGRLLGLHATAGAKVSGAESAGESKQVQSVDAGSWAEERGIKAGDRLDSILIGWIPMEPREQAEAIRKHALPDLEAVMQTDGKRFVIRDLPTKSLPVHPSQIYASITGFLLCFWSASLPGWLRRPGLVFGSGWVAYGILRYLEEIVRVDEGGQFGTSLSIAQWVSVIGIVFGTILTVVALTRRPPNLTVATEVTR